MQKLNDYLHLHNIKPAHFATKCNIPRSTFRDLGKSWQNIRLGTAYKIQDATNGFVLITDWIEDKPYPKDIELKKKSDFLNKSESEIKELDYVVVGVDERGDEVWMSTIHLNRFIKLQTTQNKLRRYVYMLREGNSYKSEQARLNFAQSLRDFISYRHYTRKHIPTAIRQTYQIKDSLNVWDCKIAEIDGKRGLHFFIHEDYKDGIFIELEDPKFQERLKDFIARKEISYGRKI